MNERLRSTRTTCIQTTMMGDDSMADPFLDKRVVKYDQWLKEGKIRFSSKVIPVKKTIQGAKWVLPAEEALDIIRKSDKFALAACTCRTHYNHCDAPRDVCLLLNDMAESYLKDGKARCITLEDAEAVLLESEKHGLVHLSFYQPGEKLYALCSCCGCCCHDLRIMKLYKRPDIIAKSDYVAVTDPNACSDCCLCVDACPFEARLNNDGLLYDKNACYGCGVCIPACPEGAIVMELRISA